MNATLKEGIDWVGFVDWNVRDFHSYTTGRGATYNAYLVQDEKTALIDTVKVPYAGRLFHHISEKMPLENVDYVVCNHAEPDHAGSMQTVLAGLPSATLLCNKKCFDALNLYQDTSSWKVQIIEDGEQVSLGSKTLTFINTPMVHWPESMFTYIPEEKILFSMDAFGQHLATSGRFDNAAPLDIIMAEAKTYYANIVTPYGRQVLKVLEKGAALDIDMIATSHGVIWRDHLPLIVDSYRRWASGEVKPKVLVIYDSMWESTAAMADAIVEGASTEGVEVRLLSVRQSNLTEIATEMLEAAAVAFGSSTLNTKMMPSMASVLNYIGGLRFPKKATVAFGSYGWGRGACEEITAWIEQSGWHPVCDAIKTRYRPTEEVLETCRETGRQLTEMAKKLAC